ncbi:MAG: fasciclin domain-containing protein [Myxococcales bacterium]|nr:fasciclin domain-containing protein [Myxococcales bacterium]
MKFSAWSAGKVVVFAASLLVVTGCPGPEDGPDGGTGGGSTAGGSAGGAAAGGSAGGSTAGGSAGGSTAGGSAGGSTAGGSAGGSMAGGSAGGAALGDIVAVAQSNADFSILVQAVTRANLAGALQAATPRKTVFAPTNAAFTALFTQLGVAGVNDLSVDQLTVILKYHVLPAEVNAVAATAAAMANTKVDSLGGKIQLSLQGTTIRLDSRASVVTPNVVASNGIIHAIDQVILPSLLDVATTDERFSSLAAAVVASNQPALVAQLDDNAQTPKLTVFAPTNGAFDGLVGALRGADDGGTTGINALTSFSETQLRPVLAYHVIPSEVPASGVPATGTVATLGGRVAVTRTGSTVTVDGVQVVIADIRTANGIIHAIGSVLLPSIADIATAPASAANFSSLAAAIGVADTLGDGGTNAAGIAAALDTTRADGGGYTVFAPTNAAFAATVSALRGADDGGTTGITGLGSFRPAQVAPILRYHVVPAQVLASQVPTTATAVGTLGGTVQALRTGANVTIDGKAVAAANVFASNGVIHVLGDVLLPSIADVVTTEPSLSTLASLVGGAPTVATALDGTTNFTLFAPNNAALVGVTPPTGQALTDLLLYHAGTSVGSTVTSPIYANTVLGLSTQVGLSTALPNRTLAVGPVAGTVRVAPIPSGMTPAALTNTSIQVVNPNLFTSNGVIHMINGVLVP